MLRAKLGLGSRTGMARVSVGLFCQKAEVRVL